MFRFSQYIANGKLMDRTQLAHRLHKSVGYYAYRLSWALKSVSLSETGAPENIMNCCLSLVLVPHTKSNKIDLREGNLLAGEA
jgi:hypothetical protein